jgi:hypothetical protein
MTARQVIIAMLITWFLTVLTVCALLGAMVSIPKALDVNVSCEWDVNAAQAHITNLEPLPEPGGHR